MLEVNEEDEENEEYADSPVKPDYSHALVLYQDEGSKLSEAQELLNNIDMRVQALKRGEILNYGSDKDPLYLEIEDDIQEKLILSAEEIDLRRRLKEQEDNLAEILIEIEAKEKLFKEAIIENDRLNDIEDGLNPENGEISVRTAAHKFSALRGARLNKAKASKTDIPEEKIIFEVEEDSDNEETSRLDQMLENAKNFNEDFEAVGSSNNFYQDHLLSMNMISEELGTDERDRIYLNAHNEGNNIPEEEKEANPNE